MSKNNLGTFLLQVMSFSMKDDILDLVDLVSIKTGILYNLETKEQN